jgi:hypothetical protein
MKLTTGPPTPVKAGMLLKSEMSAAEWTIASSWMSLSNISRDNTDITDINNRRKTSNSKDTRYSRN